MSFLFFFILEKISASIIDFECCKEQAGSFCNIDLWKKQTFFFNALWTHYQYHSNDNTSDYQTFKYGVFKLIFSKIILTKSLSGSSPGLPATNKLRFVYAENM